MYGRLAYALISLLLLTLTAVSTAYAQDAVRHAELDPTISVMLEGEAANAPVLVDDNGQHYLEASSILDALGNEVRFDTINNILTVWRSQDGVEMSLNTESGLISANGKDLGHLKTFGDVGEDHIHLTPNALSILTGLIPKYDKESGIYELELDPRLRVVTGFDILVQDIPLIDTDVEPLSVGPVLLLPLRPIVEQLGHELIVEGSVVTVTRVQDSAVFSLDLDTGVLSIRDRPLGVARDITYARPEQLLIPLGAVETLTGTHIRVDGSNIEIVLDSRLSDLILPDGDVDEELASTPFVAESLAFSLGPQQVNRADFTFRARSINGRVRVETPDLPGSTAELEPSWLSLDFAHASGVRGSVGDIFAENRELDPVNATRLRGLTLQKTVDGGRWSVSAGAPVSGSRDISEDHTRLEFGGFAAGARYRDVDGWEAGLAIRHDAITDDQRAILSAISHRLKVSPTIEATAEADLGIFNGPAKDAPVDVSMRAVGRWLASETVDVTANATYVGAEFTRSNLEEAARLEELDGQPDVIDPLLRDIRKAGVDHASYGISARYTPTADKDDEGSFIRGFAVSADASEDRTGVFVGDTRVRRSAAVRVGGSLGDTGLGVSASARVFEDKGETVTSGTTLSAGAYKSFGFVKTRANGSRTMLADGTTSDYATATVTLDPKSLELPKGAGISVSPSLSAAYRDGDANVRAGVIANFSSGSLFGSKNRVRAGFGVVQSLDPTGEHRTTEFLQISADRRLPIGDNLALGLSYGTNLDGNQRLGLTLQGRYDFNASRRLARTKDGTGVLTGSVFLDANRDGIKQEDEKPLPGMLVRIANSRLALRADGGGSFTIQNISEGIHGVKLVTDNLPLGYALADDVGTRVSIKDGKITHIDLPVVQRGQIRGFAYYDENGNGQYDKGESRPADIRLTLRGADGDTKRLTAAFGQFAYDDLPASDYDILFDGEVVASVALSDFDSLMGKIAVALPARRFADSDPPEEHTKEAAPAEPAP